MGLVKNYQNKKGDKSSVRSKNAYKPRPPFSTVEGVESEAWERLSREGVFVLMRFYRKFDGYNRYDLSLTYKEIKDKMACSLFSKAIWENIGYGFLDVRRFGRLERNCSLYGLSNRWRNLSKVPEKLDKIGTLLAQVEHLKRQSGSQEKRMKIYKLRHKILSIGSKI